MAYTTPKVDWDATDYYNVADYARLYENARLTGALSAIMIPASISWTALTLPTITTVDNIREDLNTLLTNIDNIRAAMIGLIPSLSTITHDWAAGPNAHSPDYADVNQQEQTVDTIWDYWNGDALPVCPTLAADLTIPTGTTAIYVDCIDADGFDIIIEGTGVLAII